MTKSPGAPAEAIPAYKAGFRAPPCCEEGKSVVKVTAAAFALAAPLILTGVYYFPGYSHLPAIALSFAALALAAAGQPVWSGFALGLVYNPDLPAQAGYVRDGLSIGQVFSLIIGPRPVKLVVDLQDFGRHVFPPLMVYSYLPFVILPLYLNRRKPA